MSYRIVERVFSDDENLPTVMLANIYGTPSIQENLKKMEQIINLAHEKKVNILIFPELTNFPGAHDFRLCMEIK